MRCVQELVCSKKLNDKYICLKKNDVTAVSEHHSTREKRSFQTSGRASWSEARPIWGREPLKGRSLNKLSYNKSMKFSVFLTCFNLQPFLLDVWYPQSLRNKKRLFLEPNRTSMFYFQPFEVNHMAPIHVSILSLGWSRGAGALVASSPGGKGANFHGFGGLLVTRLKQNLAFF